VQLPEWTFDLKYISANFNPNPNSNPSPNSKSSPNPKAQKRFRKNKMTSLSGKCPDTGPDDLANIGTAETRQ